MLCHHVVAGLSWRMPADNDALCKPAAIKQPPTRETYTSPPSRTISLTLLPTCAQNASQSTRSTPSTHSNRNVVPPSTHGHAIRHRRATPLLACSSSWVAATCL